MPSATETRTRASALPADQRRAAIVDATLPLLYEHGATVSTRQIAEAAGIAEGTIFRVFPDKQALLQAAVETAFDTAPIEEAIAAIDRGQPLEGQLVEAMRLLQSRFATIWRLLPVARDLGVIRPGAPKRPDVRAVTELLTPFADELRLDPETSARRLRSMALATSHPGFEPEGPPPAEEIVTLLLDGLRRPARKGRR